MEVACPRDAPTAYWSENKAPAAQLCCPGALRLIPPLTEEPSPLAVLNSPPLTEESLRRAVLFSPPLIEENRPLAVLPCPPLTEAKSPLASLFSPWRVAKKSVKFQSSAFKLLIYQ